MGGKTESDGGLPLSMARSAAGEEERSVASQRGDGVLSKDVASDAGTSQDGSGAGASRTMIPPPPRSRFGTLPRLGMPSSSSGDVGNSASVVASEATCPTKYTSVFQSPVKGGNTSASTADTPSRLARFREANWAAKETKKRPRDVENESAIQPPRARTVTRLFADEAPHESTASSQEDADPDDTSARSDTTATSTTAIQSSTSAPLDAVRSEEEERKMLERDTEIALGLHQDLVRDSARLKLKMDSLKDEIDYYFDILARIEQVAASARMAVERTAGTEEPDNGGAASISKLANGLQRIISAAKPTASSVLSAPSGNSAPDDPAPASQRSSAVVPMITSVRRG